MKTLALTFIAVFALMQPAYAYIDPGTGSLIIQGLVGAALAATLFLRQIRDKITAVFSKLRNKKNANDGDHA